MFSDLLNLAIRCSIVCVGLLAFISKPVILSHSLRRRAMESSETTMHKLFKRKGSTKFVVVAGRSVKVKKDLQGSMRGA